MTKNTKNRIAYVWLWIWLLIVTAAAACFYIEIFDSTVAVIAEFPIVLSAFEVKGDSWVTTFLKLVGGVLFCWRAVKVFVLHGVPLRFGKHLRVGSENNVASGRLVTSVSIGDSSQGQVLNQGLLFGVIFRAHPTSDKLMRTRLEMLIAALPLGRSLVIEESRISLPKYGKQERTANFVARVNKYYGKPSERNTF